MVSSVTTLTLRGGELAPAIPQTQHDYHLGQQQRSRSNRESSTIVNQSINDSHAEALLLPPVLRLRGISSNQNSDRNNINRHIHWDESVINNEGMNKKKSKVCCIYHAPREFGESSEESSSSEDSSDSSENSSRFNDNTKHSSPRSTHRSKAAAKSHRGRHHKCNDNEIKYSKNKCNTRQRSPNAYEKLPRPQNLRSKVVET